MGIWTLLQITIDLAFVGGLGVAFWRLRRPPQDDPRLSRGLQLLQTKITVLEDLSDRSDAQVKQLTQLLDQKARMLQNKIVEAEEQMIKIDHSMSKSLEVAEIFQDKIPHHEIVERQRTIEYVKAARMANSGLGTDDIASQVHLPREQVELIAKFNRDQLMFDETQLPAWVEKNSDDFLAVEPGQSVSDMTQPIPTPNQAAETPVVSVTSASTHSSTHGFGAVAPVAQQNKSGAGLGPSARANGMDREQFQLNKVDFTPQSTPKPFTPETKGSPEIKKVIFPRIER